MFSFIGIQKAQCPFCYQQIYLLGYDDHINACQILIECEICDKQVNQQEYDHHLAQHLENGQVSFIGREEMQRYQSIIQNTQQSRIRSSQIRQKITDSQINQMTDEQLYDFFTTLDQDIKNGFSQSVINNIPQQRLPTQSKDLTCSICLIEIENTDTSFLPCTHKFHSDCIKNWLQQKKTCPICLIEVKLQ